MATEEEIEEFCDEINEQISDEADNTEKYTQEESANIYEIIASTCEGRARAIREEMRS